MIKDKKERGGNGSPITVTANIFQDIQKFFDCNTLLEFMDEKKHKFTHMNNRDDEFDNESAVSTEDGSFSERTYDNFPEEFHIEIKWPHIKDTLEANAEEDGLTHLTVSCEDDIDKVMACRCINARGAIAHGKPPGLRYKASELTATTVDSIFEKYGEGSKVLETIREIKFELMNHGPVVSTSFRLSKKLADREEFKDSFLMSQIGENHPLLITGWRLTEFGQVWIVNHLNGNKDHIIAFGQFAIDLECLAPKGNFENTPWQLGPYFDHDFSRVAEDWRQWPNLKMYLKSNDLERLAVCFNPGTGLVHAATCKEPFEICNKNRKAHSRTCCVKEISWDQSRTRWKVAAIFL